MRTWIFQSGWVRQVRPTTFTRFQVMTFAELDEPPDYFLKELKQDKQMNFYQLESYIGDLQQSGFDTIRLRVQLYKKFSVPQFALIMATISIPFRLSGGQPRRHGRHRREHWNRDGVLGRGQLFEQIGNANQLPPGLAAWSPDVIFALAGTYLLLRAKLMTCRSGFVTVSKPLPTVAARHPATEAATEGSGLSLRQANSSASMRPPGRVQFFPRRPPAGRILKRSSASAARAAAAGACCPGCGDPILKSKERGQQASHETAGSVRSAARPAGLRRRPAGCMVRPRAARSLSCSGESRAF
jgi:hypothetical protein